MIACQQADECEGFTYNAVLQQCFLKREQASLAAGHGQGCCTVDLECSTGKGGWYPTPILTKPAWAAFLPSAVPPDRLLPQPAGAVQLHQRPR